MNCALKDAAIAALKNKLDQVLPSKAFPAENIEKMAETLAGFDRRITQDPEKAEELAAQADQQMESFLDGCKPNASFHLVSDVHINCTQERENNYARALQDMAGVMADTCIGLVNPGDMTGGSAPQQYADFYRITEQYNPCTPENTLLLLGNHDVRGASGEKMVDWCRDPRYPERCVHWEASKALYLKYNAPYMPADDKTTLYHSKVLGGYTFLMLNTELGLKDAMYMSDAQLAWFEEKMKESYEQDTNRPVFIVSHQALNNTHWRSNVLEGFDGLGNEVGSGPNGKIREYSLNRDAAVKAIMAKYPVGVFLSGHIHNQLGMVEVQMKEYGIAVDVPSFAEPEIGIPDVGTGFEVAFYGDQLIFRARNFVTGRWLPEYDTVVELPAASVLYQKALAKKAAGESTPELDTAAEKLGSLLTRTYDQEGLAWNHSTPPAVRLYDRKDLAEIELARSALEKLL